MKSLVIKLIIMGGLCMPYLGHAQSRPSTPLQIGKTFPEFVLKDMHYYDKSEQSISELKGKYVILDFFNKGCVSCFEAMPHLKKIQEKYKGRLDIILVGVARKSDLIENTKKMYEAFRKIKKLNFPVAYDTTVFKKFGIAAGPLSVWIDREGILKAITVGQVEPSNIDAFISGKDFVFVDQNPAISYTEAANAYDLSKPLLINGNGGNDSTFISRSVLYESDQKSIYFSNSGIEYQFDDHKGLFQFVGNNLSSIYRLAYFGVGDVIEYDKDKGKEQLYGNYLNNLQLNIKDSTYFYRNPRTKLDRNFNYSLSYPLKFANKDYIQACLQNDLKRTFGYNVRIVEQLHSFYRLVATPSAKKKLIAKKQVRDTVSLEKIFGLTIKNQPISYLVHCIASNGTVTSEMPVIDDTGITSNVDLELKCAWSDFTNVKKELNKVGLDLVEDKKMMKALVISDPLNTSAQN